MPRLTPVTANDSKTMARLHAETFSGEGWTADWFEARLTEPGILGFLAWRDNAPVGLIFARHILGEAEILTFGVSPVYRRQGTGIRLLERLITALQTDNAGEIFLEVAQNNHAARALYKRRGFSVTGRRPDYYGPGEDALVLHLRLPRAENAV